VAENTRVTHTRALRSIYKKYSRPGTITITTTRPRKHRFRVPLLHPEGHGLRRRRRRCGGLDSVGGEAKRQRIRTVPKMGRWRWGAVANGNPWHCRGVEGADDDGVVNERRRCQPSGIPGCKHWAVCAAIFVLSALLLYVLYFYYHHYYNIVDTAIIRLSVNPRLGVAAHYRQ